MKNIKLYIIGGALLFITVGVFAKKSKSSGALYAYDASTVTWYLLGSVNPAGNWAAIGTIQAETIDMTGNKFPLYINASLTNPVFVLNAF